MSDTARNLSRRSIEVISLTNACYLHQICRDWRAVSEKSNSVLLQVKETQLSTFRIIAKICRGWADVNSGTKSVDLDDILKGLESMRQTGASAGCAADHRSSPVVNGVTFPGEGVPGTHLSSI